MQEKFSIVRTTYYVRDASGNVLSIYQKADSIGGTINPYSSLRQLEVPLYGSNRLGLHKVNRLMERWDITSTLVGNVVQITGYTSTFAAATQPGPTTRHSRIVGHKYYELSNHLGNVLATVSDRKLVSIDGSGSPFVITGYVAEVLHAQDFYPFGMAMPGRSYEAGAYRFGFQGQEQDDEVKGVGNSVNYKYRVHDPRLGRFLSIDPLAPEYPWNSPYAFSENKLGLGVELEGAELLEWFEDLLNFFGYENPLNRSTFETADQEREYHAEMARRRHSSDSFLGDMEKQYARQKSILTMTIPGGSFFYKLIEENSDQRTFNVEPESWGSIIFWGSIDMFSAGQGGKAKPAVKALGREAIEELALMTPKIGEEFGLIYFRFGNQVDGKWRPYIGKTLEEGANGFKSYLKRYGQQFRNPRYGPIGEDRLFGMLAVPYELTEAIEAILIRINTPVNEMLSKKGRTSNAIIDNLNRAGGSIDAGLLKKAEKWLDNNIPDWESIFKFDESHIKDSIGH